MACGLSARLFRRQDRKAFAAWQIELDTHCPLECRMCIRQASANLVRRGYGYRSLSPAFQSLQRSRAGRTRGMGRIASLSEAGVGLMGFSLAGATRSTHNAIQVHSDLEATLASIKELNEIRIERRSITAHLHIVFS